ncbi:hypothetical protein NMY22_g13000 [Coprinellus aureogranulatus]|nr:hypothetical protein NMY22_g13000 [Coprinellus aureogranulatus]
MFNDLDSPTSSITPVTPAMNKMGPAYEQSRPVSPLAFRFSCKHQPSRKREKHEVTTAFVRDEYRAVFDLLRGILTRQSPL